MKTSLILTAAALVLAAVPTHAQERSAGQSNDVQINYAILNSKLDFVSQQISMLTASINSVSSTVGALTKKVDDMSTLLNKIANCSGNKKFYNGSSCVAPDVVTPPPTQVTLTTKTLNLKCVSTNGSCYHADSATENKVCQDAGYTGMTGVSTWSFSSPGNNSVVKWQGGKWVTEGASGQNSMIDTLTCYKTSQ